MSDLEGFATLQECRIFDPPLPVEISERGTQISSEPKLYLHGQNKKTHLLYLMHAKNLLENLHTFLCQNHFVSFFCAFFSLNLQPYDL